MPVRYEVMGRIAVVSIQRPERRNAVDRRTAVELAAAWDRFDRDETVDVGILWGAGGDFSAGADLVAFDLVDTPGGFLGFTRTRVGKPTIAAVEGHCVAGGLEMALWCDLRVAGDGARFGCLERRFGVPLVDGGTQRLPRVVGLGRALDLILTGRLVDTAEAARIGLVDRVVEAGRALDAALELAEQIASFPQRTLRSDREAVMRGLGLDLADGLELERAVGRHVLDEAVAGAARFRAGAGRGGEQVPAGDEPSGGEQVPAGDEPSGGEEARPADAEPMEAVEEAPIRPKPPAVDDTLDVPPEVTITVERDPGEPREAGPVEEGGDEGVLLPPGGRGPGLIVLHDRWGAAKPVLHAAERLAEAGYVVSVPDLFAGRLPQTETEADTLVRGLDVESATATVVAEVGRLLDDERVVSEEIALAGFGTGSALAVWVATVDQRVGACVTFGSPRPWWGSAPVYTQAGAAFLGHEDRDDAGASRASYQLETTLRALGLDATFHAYPGVGPGFWDPDHSEAPSLTDLAWERTFLFLRRTLS